MLDYRVVLEKTALKHTAVLVALAMFALPGLGRAAQRKASPKKQVGHAVAKAGHARAVSPHTAPANTGKGHTTSRRTARARHTAPPPPRRYGPQTPTPERYQEIQKALAERGFFKGEVNGQWGSDSVAALRDFQQANSLDPDGKLGSLSLIALGLGPKRVSAEKTEIPATNVPTPQ